MKSCEHGPMWHLSIPAHSFNSFWKWASVEIGQVLSKYLIFSHATNSRLLRAIQMTSVKDQLYVNNRCACAREP